MGSPASWPRPAGWVLAASLLCATLVPGDATRAQTPASGQGQAPAQAGSRSSGATVRSGAGGDRLGANPPRAQAKVQAPPSTKAQEVRRQPSAAYQESLRLTLEKRRQRRARRQQAQGLDDAPRPIGAIVPWLMPPALIIRHTPEVHGEVGSFLDGLRR
jgi:hypothetical protein